MAKRATRLQPQGETLQFMRQIWALAHALEVRSKRMAKTIGVTGPQRLVIRLIGQRPDISATDLATLLGIHPSTLTGVIARLQRDKLIERKTTTEDRRRAAFRLTPEGREIDRERRGTVEAGIRRALARATPEMIEHTEQVLALLVAELLEDK